MRRWPRRGRRGGGNNVIDLNVDATITGTPSGPNLTFTDGTNTSLAVVVTNIGKLGSDQLVTVTVGLPTGITFVSFVSTTPGWTCTASGQTITCTSSASIAGLTGSSTVTINVSVANNASGTPRLTLSVSTPDGTPTTNSGSKGVIFNASGGGGCASGGSAAGLLTGDYAFSGQGFLPMTAGFAATAGRFHADGVNTISNGLLEYNSVTSGNSTNGTPVAFTGCFVLNTPPNASGLGLGTMTMVNSSIPLNITLAIAIQTNGNGRFISFDSTSTRVSGYLEKQCPNAGSCPAFANSNVAGDYGFGFDGLTTTGPTANVGAAGRLTANGSGGVSGAVMDISTSGGVIALDDAFSASYKVTDSANGRVEITANITYNSGSANGAAETFHFACYVANLSNSGTATVMHCMSSDTPTGPLPLLSGRILTQSTPGGGWTNSNVVPATGASVGSGTGIDGSGTPRTEISQVSSWNPSANPPTAFLSQDVNKGGSSVFQSGTLDYGVATNGRATITNPSTNPPTLLSVLYVVAPGKGFSVNEANNATLSFFEPQETEPSGGFSTANFDNTYAFGTVNPIENAVSDIDGVITTTGSTGTLSGTEDVNSSTSGTSSPAVAATYTIASGSDAAIGRVTITVTSPGADTLVLYIIDANTAVAMSTVSGDPAVIYAVH